MKIKDMKLSWKVMRYNFNAKEVEFFNIFRNIRLQEGLENLIKNYTTFNKFKEDLSHELKYCFLGKCEYEVVVGDIVIKTLDELEKVDVYAQLEPNLDILAKYIIDEVNKHKRNKLSL